jgi:ABC-2 type transport system ATP-binding protein
VALLLATVALLASCASTSTKESSGAGAGTPTTATTATAKAWKPAPCRIGPSRPTPVAVAVPGVASDYTLTSFDSTLLRIHWFPTAGAKPAPTVLMGPGWSLSGDTDVNGTALFGGLGIGPMNKAGYNVLTWDPRGFGKSAGVATVNDPLHEGKDAQVLLDWVAHRPEALLDSPGDPRVGMVGWSYGGGIQLTLASQDCRVDAIVPGLGWHSLHTSLDKADTVKAGWSSVLASAAVGDKLDPHIISAQTTGLSSGVLSADDVAWFTARGPGDAIKKIDVPTLFVQGTVDTLFSLDEAITNYRILRSNGVPTAMLWFCGGHGTCLVNPGDPNRVAQATTNWLDRYLKRDTSVATGPRLDLVDQDGVRWTASDYPVPAGTPVTATGSGELDLTADGGAGPIQLPAKPDLLGTLVQPITPAKATNAVNVTIDPGSVNALALGAPKLEITYSGTADPGPRPTRVFAQLVDDTTGVVVGDQITPVDVTLDGKKHSTSTDLEVIAQHLTPGHTVTLQLVATTVAYAVPRLDGRINFGSVSISLPTAKASAIHRS